MLKRLLCVFLLIIGVGTNMSITKTTANIKNKLLDVLLSCDKIILYNDNNSYFCDENQQNLINISIIEMLKDSHEMPAFGVSLDNETRQELKSGLWVEFIYNHTNQYNEMYFDKLLIKVNKSDMGFNICREYNGLYEGRCYYISLNGDMEVLYNKIIDIVK